MIGRRRLLTAAGLALVAALGTPLGVLARGGSGQYFGGGGGGGGGGFFGGGYSGGLGGGYLPIPFFFGGGGGLFGFFFLIFILYSLYQAYRRTTIGTPTGPYAGSSWSPPLRSVVASQPNPAEGRAALIAKDPNFNEQVFLDRVQAAFFALEKAWMDRNLEPARVYMSDGLYRRWKAQIDGMIAQHKRNVMENLVIGGVRIVAVGSDANFDAITARIDASCADYDVDEQSGRVVFGSHQNTPFTEYWTFIRSASARTKAGETAEVATCPNCGAPLSISESGVCSYCKATVTTGQFGWVLDNITQASEWQG